MGPRKVALAGAAGSIGQSALKVLRSFPDDLALTAIAGRRRAGPLGAIAREFDVRHVAIHEEEACRQARASGGFPEGTRFYCGETGLAELVSLDEVDIVVMAASGTAGLKPTLAAIEAGKDIALASKEILVLAGRFVMAAAGRRRARILPVDSEHSAVFQCLQGVSREAVSKIILTASGGPFLDYTPAQMAGIRPADAMSHPTWSMGRKITVDSATLANKGLEIIEARWLFDMPPRRVEVAVHPQSIVHSMVELSDGSVLAQMSPPCMTFAIQHALLYPDRARGSGQRLDFRQNLRLDFRPPDLERFPCLRLARRSAAEGGAAPAIFNAANDEAVRAFLENRISFLAIPEIIDITLSQMDRSEPQELAQALAADESARRRARSVIRQRHG